VPAAADDPLKLTENVLRELIQDLMSERHGPDWISQLKVTPERVAKWDERRDEERKRRAGTVADERLLWYSDWTDLRTIFEKHWELFEPCFGNKKRFDTYLDRLGGLRNPQAHARPLRPFERALIDGMTGEIRQQVTLFRSAGGGGPEPEHFPRIESLIDSFGNTKDTIMFGVVHTKLTLRPGDVVTFSGSAWDPNGDPVSWKARFLHGPVLRDWQEGNELECTWLVQESDIAESVFLEFSLRSNKTYHRQLGTDDKATFMYTVLPRLGPG
jgi:Swt1-like HEPN